MIIKIIQAELKLDSVSCSRSSGIVEIKTTRRSEKQTKAAKCLKDKHH